MDLPRPALGGYGRCLVIWNAYSNAISFIRGSSTIQKVEEINECPT
jgi:hypothetical protein